MADYPGDDDKTPVELAGPVFTWEPNRPLFADINHWHPVADWDAYARSCSARCVGIKICQAGIVPTRAREWVRSAEARGLVVVGYCYGCEHVDVFLQTFQPGNGRVPALDFEGVTATVAGAEAFVRSVATAWGRPPWFYGGSDWRRAGQPAGTEIERCPYWGPQYGPVLSVPRGVGKPVAWQYTDGLVHPPGAPVSHPGMGINEHGVPNPCDMNALLVTPEELAASCGAK